MESHTSSILPVDDETRDLKQLLITFGSVVSLEDIATAYCQAGRNIHAAGELLLNMHGSTSGSSPLSSKNAPESLNWCSELDKGNFSESNSIPTKQKKSSASMGTVSGVIGRDYARVKPSRNEYHEGSKPSRVNLDEAVVHQTSTVESMHKDVEEFLFKMLGDGFQLEMNVIQEVLGLCGYDLEMGLDKLLDLSASASGVGVAALHVTAEKPVKVCSDASTETARSKGRNELQKELLEALFAVPERIEEVPRKTGLAKPYRKPRPFGKVVTEPYKDVSTDSMATVATLLGREEDNEDAEDSYETLRKAVQNYWETMKAYYKSAVDAFTKGDHEHADKFLEAGHFYKKKARDADEKSAQMFLETRDEGMSLDLNEYSPKEAIRLLKLHLASLSGIHAFPYLKIVVGGDNESTKDAARKRLVLKFLEKESVKWSEEGNGRTIIIRLGEIDPKGLSYARK